MKASELVKQLNSLMEFHGDMNINICVSEYGNDMNHQNFPDIFFDFENGQFNCELEINIKD